MAIRRWIFLSLLILVGCKPGQVANPIPSKPISLPAADDVKSVRIARGGVEYAALLPAEAQTTDQTVIRGLLDVCRQAVQTEMHECKSCATLTIERTSGETVELRLRWGHNDEFAEFEWHGEFYRVDRRQFAAAVAPLGVKEWPTVDGASR